MASANQGAWNSAWANSFRTGPARKEQGMLRSMTGFGRCFAEDKAVSQQWEIKSVNGRYLDFKWRLPPIARYLEQSLEKLARKYALRGHIEISLSLQFAPGHAPQPLFDVQQANAMLEQLKSLATARNEIFAPDYSRFISLPALWGEPETESVENFSASLEEGLKAALQDWNESRAEEGERLGRDLEGRVSQMNEWADILQQAAPQVKEEKIQTLRERLAAILNDSDFELSEDRFLQEIVLLSDRLDVSEELTRLASHLERLRQLLRAGCDAGKKIDFTLQECFREINTCGNKIQDADLSRIVVDFKNELEKCREQAQNLE